MHVSPSRSLCVCLYICSWCFVSEHISRVPPVHLSSCPGLPHAPQSHRLRSLWGAEVEAVQPFTPQHPCCRGSCSPTGIVYTGVFKVNNSVIHLYTLRSCNSLRFKVRLEGLCFKVILSNPLSVTSLGVEEPGSLHGDSRNHRPLCPGPADPCCAVRVHRWPG